MVTSYENIGTANDILKRFYVDPVREQLNSATILMKRLTRNTEDIQGGTAYIALHNARNYGTGARPAGYNLPVMGKQGHIQASTSLKYNYGRFFVSGPDIQKTRGKKGAFVRIVDNEIQGLVTDLKKDLNRQMFSDGSGILCFTAATATGTTTSGTFTVYPYLWSPATKYLDTTGTEIAAIDFSGGFNAYVPAESDTAGTAIKVAASTTTYTEGAVCTAGWSRDTNFTSSFGENDPITKWRAGFLNVSNTFVRRELMGLDGIIHDTDLIGDVNWLYGRTGSLTTWKQPETADAPDVGIASATNNLQGVDANDNLFWRAKVNDNSGVPRALTIAMMNEMSGYLRTVQGVTPSLILTTYKTRNKYAQLLAEDRRYVNTMTLDGGFSAVEFNGMPLTDDADCPRGRMYFVDESALQLYVGEDFSWIEDGSGGVLHYISGYDAFEAVLRYYAELGTSRRNAHGKIIDLIES